MGIGQNPFYETLVLFGTPNDGQSPEPKHVILYHSISPESLKMKCV
jgi:hypothetical protein